MLSGPTYAETAKADAVDRIPQHSEKPLECLKANIINHIGEALTASVSQSFTKIMVAETCAPRGNLNLVYLSSDARLSVERTREQNR